MIDDVWNKIGRLIPRRLARAAAARRGGDYKCHWRNCQIAGLLPYSPDRTHRKCSGQTDQLRIHIPKIARLRVTESSEDSDHLVGNSEISSSRQSPRRAERWPGGGMITGRGGALVSLNEDAKIIWAPCFLDNASRFRDASLTVGKHHRGFYRPISVWGCRIRKPPQGKSNPPGDSASRSDSLNHIGGMNAGPEHATVTHPLPRTIYVPIPCIAIW
jgi:hypothetical protein